MNDQSTYLPIFTSRSRWLALLLIVAIAGAAWMLGTRLGGQAAGAAPIAGAQTGMIAPDITLQAIDGSQTTLSSLRGKAVLLNLWASWCPPCRAEMPSMERLHARLKDKGVVVLGVDLQEGKREVEDFVREHKISFPVVLDRNGSAGAAYGVRSIPTTFIVGRDGAILAGRIGGHEWDDPVVVALFEKLVAR